MSLYAIESALHALSTSRVARKDYQIDQGKYLDRFPFTPPERSAIETFDIRALLGMGVNALLTYGFWMTNALDKSRDAYLRAAS